MKQRKINFAILLPINCVNFNFSLFNESIKCDHRIFLNIWVSNIQSTCVGFILFVIYEASTPRILFAHLSNKLAVILNLWTLKFRKVGCWSCSIKETINHYFPNFQKSPQEIENHWFKYVLVNHLIWHSTGSNNI